MQRLRYDQPWHRASIAGRRVRVQVLDPETAFELEPRLISTFGDQLALTLAAPGPLRQALLAAPESTDGRDPWETLPVVRTLRLIQACLVKLDVDPAFVVEVVETLLLDRLSVGNKVIEDWPDFREAFGLSPSARWSATAIALSLTFGPLWTRKPYRLRSQAHDYGVPLPPGVSKVRLWCEQLAAEGRAASAHDILRCWTPIEVLESVESLAYVAERERRAAQAARQQGAGR